MEWLRMTAKEYREFRTRGKAQPARGTAKLQANSLQGGTTHIKSPNTYNKYNAKKVEINGVQFDSKKEAQQWLKLENLAHRGIISELQRQVRFELVPKQKDERAVYYVADYVFKQDGKMVVADCKSAMTKKLPAYIIKRKLFKWRYPEYEFREM